MRKNISVQHDLIYRTASRAYHLIPDNLHKIKNNKLIKASLPDVEKMRNMYMGERCFVIGNGPSLMPQDVSLLKDEITFGSNKIYKIFDKTDWRPTFYCAQDIGFIQDDSSMINQVKSQKFIGIVVSANYPRINDAIFVRLFTKPFYPKLPAISNDATNGVYEGLTVTYMCLQLAIYMGFKEIYLLGVDHCYPKMIDASGQYVETDMNAHFSSDYKCEKVISIEKTTLAYKAARQYADSHNVRIYNATRGGMLEVFERVNFDSLFEDQAI